MKTKLFTIILLFASMCIHAQLIVNSSGNVLAPKTVSVGTTSVDTCVTLNVSKTVLGSGSHYGIKSMESAPTSTLASSIYGVHGLAEASSIGTNTVLKQIVGVYGKAFVANTSVNRFTVGVAGVANGPRSVGVYGAVTSNSNYTLPFGFETGTFYAGYFAGNVKATGSVTAPSFPVSSDARLKTDIKSIDYSLSDKLMELRPVYYKFKSDDTIHFSYPKDAKEMQVAHYGLIAQEVQEIFPDVVYDSGDGYLSINYIELIPMLIQTVQKQQQQIDELLQAVMSNKSQMRASAATDTKAILYQNTPNPFNKQTEIRYVLPEKTNSAFIYIYDMSGTQIAGYSLTERGAGTLTLEGNTLSAGIYLYSLVADGQLIDTKQMILTK